MRTAPSWWRASVQRAAMCRSLAKFTMPVAGPSFGTNGVVELIPCRGHHSRARPSTVIGRSLIVRPDPDTGRERNDIFVTRLTIGATDTTFGTNGVCAIRAVRSTIAAIAPRGSVQPDGKIVVGGRTRSPGAGYDFLLMRLDAMERPTHRSAPGVVTSHIPWFNREQSSAASRSCNRTARSCCSVQVHLAAINPVRDRTVQHRRHARCRNSAPGAGLSRRRPRLFRFSQQADGKLVIVGQGPGGRRWLRTSCVVLLDGGTPDAGFGNRRHHLISVASADAGALCVAHQRKSWRDGPRHPGSGGRLPEIVCGGAPPTTLAGPSLNQSIAFEALADKTFGDPDFACSPASSNLAVSYGASGACTVTGSTVHLTGRGSCTINADQAGDATYNPAARVNTKFSIAAPPAGADRCVVGARGAESDDGRHRHVHADVQRSGHRRQSSNLAVVTSGITAASVGKVSGAARRGRWRSTRAAERERCTRRRQRHRHHEHRRTPLTGTPFTGETYDIDKGGTVIGSGEGQLFAGFGTAATR